MPDLEAVRKILEEARPRGHCLRLRGLPFSATAADVVAFLEGVALSEGTDSIVFTYTADGRPTGEAYIEVADEAAAAAAMAKHKERMGPRYIEVFASTKHDLLQASQQAQFQQGQAALRRRWAALNAAGAGLGSGGLGMGGPLRMGPQGGGLGMGTPYGAAPYGGLGGGMGGVDALAQAFEGAAVLVRARGPGRGLPACAAPLHSVGCSAPARAPPLPCPPSLTPAPVPRTPAAPPTAGVSLRGAQPPGGAYMVAPHDMLMGGYGGVPMGGAGLGGVPMGGMPYYLVDTSMGMAGMAGMAPGAPAPPGGGRGGGGGAGALAPGGGTPGGLPLGGYGQQAPMYLPAGGYGIPGAAQQQQQQQQLAQAPPQQAGPAQQQAYMHWPLQQGDADAQASQQMWGYGAAPGPQGEAAKMNQPCAALGAAAGAGGGRGRHRRRPQPPSRQCSSRPGIPRQCSSRPSIPRPLTQPPRPAPRLHRSQVTLAPPWERGPASRATRRAATSSSRHGGRASAPARPLARAPPAAGQGAPTTPTPCPHTARVPFEPNICLRRPPCPLAFLPANTRSLRPPLRPLPSARHPRGFSPFPFSARPAARGRASKHC
jgi:hypothetical protein